MIDRLVRMLRPVLLACSQARPARRRVVGLAELFSEEEYAETTFYHGNGIAPRCQ